MICWRAALMALVFAFPTGSRSAPDASAEAVIQRCGSIYHESGHPCACAADHARNGSACGARSAHDRPGGASPVCFPSEVSPELLEDYRSNEQAVLRERCHYHGR